MIDIGLLFVLEDNWSQILLLTLLRLSSGETHAILWSHLLLRWLCLTVLSVRLDLPLPPIFILLCNHIRESFELWSHSYAPPDHFFLDPHLCLL